MQGPMPATMRAASAPSSTIASTVRSRTPPMAPFQPACAAPMTPAPPSANSTGAQSAVSTPRARPGSRVTMASASGAASGAQGRSTRTTRSEWIWKQVTRCSASLPRRAMARARFSPTSAWRSPEP
jgi:hypothetical protein